MCQYRIGNDRLVSLAKKGLMAMVIAKLNINEWNALIHIKQSCNTSGGAQAASRLMNVLIAHCLILIRSNFEYFI